MELIHQGNDSTGVGGSSPGGSVRIVAVCSLVLAAGIPGAPATGASGRADPAEPVLSEVEPARNLNQMLSDPWVAAQLIEPVQLAKTLSDSNARKPLVLCIGPSVLYRAGHVPGSRLIGPAAQPAGMTALEKQLRDLPKDSEIVLYCGCCPWEDCPNIRPAFAAARKMGLTKLRLLHLPHSFKLDWTDKNLPIQRGE